MNSWERVQRVVNFQSVRRVPMYLGGIYVAHIAVKANARLQLQLGIHPTPLVYHPRCMVPRKEPVRAIETVPT